MKTFSKIAVLGSAVLLLGACAGLSQPNARMATAEQGARLWRRTCAGCHNARPASEFDARQWPIIVSHMRTRADLTRTEARAVAAFLSASAAGEAAGQPDRREGSVQGSEEGPS